MKKVLMLSMLAALMLVAVIQGCKHPAKNTGQATITAQETETPATGSAWNPGAGSLVADTITYDVIVRNPNPSDSWAEKCLHRLNRQKLVDSIFSAVYEGKLKPYTIFENHEMSITEVRLLEQAKDYDRSLVGKLQFSEAWYFDSSTSSIQKKPISVALGYEMPSADGLEVKYKPLFKVYINR